MGQECEQPHSPKTGHLAWNIQYIKLNKFHLDFPQPLPPKYSWYTLQQSHMVTPIAFRCTVTPVWPLLQSIQDLSKPVHAYGHDRHTCQPLREESSLELLFKPHLSSQLLTDSRNPLTLKPQLTSMTFFAILWPNIQNFLGVNLFSSGILGL